MGEGKVEQTGGGKKEGIVKGRREVEVDGEIIWQVNGGRVRNVILRENSVSVHPGLPFTT